MEFIAHRINTLEELEKVPKKYGVEIDLRDFGNRLILQHDPFKDGLDFEEYLKHYNHGIIILNIKSERIEYRVLELIKKYNVKKYFFLDSSFPMIYNISREGNNNIALRFSEFEGIDTILNLRGKVEWVWVDCFTILPINHEIFTLLKDNGFKVIVGQRKGGKSWDKALADGWEEGEMKSALVKVIANHMKKSYLSWNKDTVKDDVIFEHLLELSEGKFNLTKSSEELLNSTELLRTNKKMSNKNMPVGGKPKIVKIGKPKPYQKNNNNQK